MEHYRPALVWSMEYGYGYLSDFLFFSYDMMSYELYKYVYRRGTHSSSVISCATHILEDELLPTQCHLATWPRLSTFTILELASKPRHNKKKRKKSSPNQPSTRILVL